IARLTVLISDLPPLVDGPHPSPIAIDLAVIAPWWPRSAAQLDLVPETREPIGTLYPGDDAALSGTLEANASTLDASTPLYITASSPIDTPREYPPRAPPEPCRSSPHTRSESSAPATWPRR